MISEFNSKIIKSLCLLVFLQACAYFNTFYNAQEHYQMAEKIRMENFGNKLPSKAIQEYQSAIEKSEKVLTEYGDSKYVQDALLLKGRSHFFKNEYDSAKEVFNQLKDSEEVFFQNETKYWLALCKWKDFRPQPAINDLKDLLDETELVDLESRIYLALGEIYLEIDRPDSAFQFLDRGAKTASNRLTREQIYFQMAELSYGNELYQQASDNYKNVLSNTISVSRIRESNLKIIQTYRLLGDLDEAKKRIEQLLLDENFNSIKGKLSLELAKIELDRNNLDFAIQSLDQVAQDNQNTEVSVEAYYLLGNIFLKNPNIDFERANFFMNQGMKQNFNSPYKIIISNKRDSVNKIIALTKDSEEDISNNPSILYAIAEILAFDIGSTYEALDYFEIIINNHAESDFYTQSLFASYSIYNKKNALEGDQYKEIILEQYPQSDYAKMIIENEQLDINHEPSTLLLTAESLWATDQKKSLNIYRQILDKDSSTLSSNIAAYFLAYYYDYELSQKDSAIVYYQWIKEKHPSSDQGIIAQKRLEALNVE
ncbi:MAG: tetratricopeptide repeat protein [Candidatus Neomarinimicrobiota bacterium]|nr:tetratricopeptide repeat protein [Candidatus Neomarinimicrobiota bacterium]